MESRKSIEINFGISNYVRNAPGVPLEEMIISIPTEGELHKVREGDYPFKLIPEKAVNRIIREDLIVFPIELGAIHTEMEARWIRERNEWIGIVNSGWLESDAWGDDESHRGPYALDDYYAQRILAAFGIPLWRTEASFLLDQQVVQFSLQQVLHTSPDELKKIALLRP